MKPALIVKLIVACAICLGVAALAVYAVRTLFQ
jgi:hypothetical protein